MSHGLNPGSILGCFSPDTKLIVAPYGPAAPTLNEMQNVVAYLIFTICSS